MSAFNS
jgi:hypothetical protein